MQRSMTTVHAARLRDARAFLVDHAELTPEVAGADLDGLRARSPGSASGARKTLTMSTGSGTSTQALEALLAEDLRLARVHRNDAVAVPLQVVADEVARAQLVLRQPDDRRSSSRCGARAGSSADPGSAPDRTSSRRGHTDAARRRRRRRARSPVRGPRSDRRSIRCRPRAGSSRADAGRPAARRRSS